MIGPTVLKGFIKSITEHIRDALDLECYKDLKHSEYGYIDVVPVEYLLHLESEHSPCDGEAVKECPDHYVRGW